VWRLLVVKRILRSGWGEQGGAGERAEGLEKKVAELAADDLTGHRRRRGGKERGRKERPRVAGGKKSRNAVGLTTRNWL